MSRRARALAFALLAIAAAAIAAAIANGYGSRIAGSYGPLRRVVIARELLPAGRQIGPGALQSALELRRVPARFVPPGTLAQGSRALGLEPRSDIPAGSYVSIAALRAPGRTATPQGPHLRRGLRPVEIQVSGSGGLLFAGVPRRERRVDVVVTSEPTGAAPGRTYVAASGVPMLAIEPATGSAGTGSAATATLGLTREQALELIAAENFARQVTLLPAGTG